MLFHLHRAWYDCELTPEHITDLGIGENIHHLLSQFFVVLLRMVPAYLSQVAVLAHHLLLLLRESQVVKESVPDHLNAPRFTL